eukprot:TRINITY_DN34479_c0_g1_i2.p2 TRINITY_DN34479_c0_g1~~TRINITY_DN34479_c0_g1_i2.p2  ORF type:complete len:103 (-),score=4.99 TRINITY_DN34479_c0_g1_i2:43-351(-)
MRPNSPPTTAAVWPAIPTGQLLPPPALHDWVTGDAEVYVTLVNLQYRHLQRRNRTWSKNGRPAKRAAEPGGAHNMRLYKVISKDPRCKGPGVTETRRGRTDK